ncbi:hypothetical protein E2562_002174 [Oryza meyeriana var. granulata]|uniref:Uncharacterized protein n=1 Tax=Oryza meyeriana var. granulata TaxID=110450 RepID=A0A6G1EDV7_9ORYZ|nr:hypothetical protein E2562_002174 [Oryza meyeriana var. granulata]
MSRGCRLRVVGNGNRTGRLLGWLAGVAQSSAGSHSGSAFCRAAGGRAQLAQGGGMMGVRGEASRQLLGNARG